MSVALDNSSISSFGKSASAAWYTAFKPAWTIQDTRAPLPKWWLPAYLTLLVVSLALPRRDRIFYTFPIIAAMVGMLSFHTEGSFKKDFDLGNLALGWFFFYLGLCFGGPEQAFWKKDGRDLKPEEREAELLSKSFFERLKWSWQIWTNPRGVGWSHEAPGLLSETSGKWLAS